MVFAARADGELIRDRGQIFTFDGRVRRSSTSDNRGSEGGHTGRSVIDACEHRIGVAGVKRRQGQSTVYAKLVAWPSELCSNHQFEAAIASPTSHHALLCRTLAAQIPPQARDDKRWLPSQSSLSIPLLSLISSLLLVLHTRRRSSSMAEHLIYCTGISRTTNLHSTYLSLECYIQSTLSPPQCYGLFGLADLMVTLELSRQPGIPNEYLSSSEIYVRHVVFNLGSTHREEHSSPIRSLPMASIADDTV